MSFIGSLIDSIGGGASSSASTAPKPLAAKQRLKTSALATPVVGTKRKAENELERPTDKSLKTTNGAPPRVIKPLPQKPSQSAAATSAQELVPQKPVSSSSSTRIAPPASSPAKVPQSPIVRQGVQPKQTKTSASASRMKPEIKTPLQSNKSVGAVQSGTAPAKKSSFKERLAKAAQQGALQAIGRIVHKPTERMSAKKELAMARGKPVKGRDGSNVTRSAPNGKHKSMQDAKVPKSPPAPLQAPTNRYQGTSKSKSKSLGKNTTLYQGTAKPKAQPTYRGTSKSSTAPFQQREKSARSVERNEYLGTDEEDEDGYGYDDEDDHYMENSDDFSDMDAGFDEIGDEEEAAERQAKLDDIREMKLLDKLAREKEERRKERG